MQVIVDNQGHSRIPHVEKSDSVQKYSICTHWFAQSNMVFLVSYKLQKFSIMLQL